MEGEGFKNVATLGGGGCAAPGFVWRSDGKAGKMRVGRTNYLEYTKVCERWNRKLVCGIPNISFLLHMVLVSI
jgi:hypothetical protein